MRENGVVVRLVHIETRFSEVLLQFCRHLSGWSKCWVFIFLQRVRNILFLLNAKLTFIRNVISSSGRDRVNNILYTYAIFITRPRNFFRNIITFSFNERSTKGKHEFPVTLEFFSVVRQVFYYSNAFVRKIRHNGLIWMFSSFQFARRDMNGPWSWEQ